MKRELAKRRLLDFTTWTKPDYQVGRPHRILSKYLDKLVAGEIRRLMVFEPPRHGKSELVSRRLPAYYLGLHPDHDVIISSYAADLANRMSRDVQRIIDSDLYREVFPETRLREPGSRSTGGIRALRTDELFEIVDHHGSLRSAGIGGGITGMGFHLGIIDDPFKDFEEGHSQTIRDKVDEWYSSTFWTRQAPGARILLTMTRWNYDDLAGRLLQRMKEDPDAEQWTVLRLPGVADGDLHEDDDRKEGEALWPERFDERFMARARVTQGSYQFAGMYQQTPTMEGGNHFQESWFKRSFQDGGTHWHVERNNIWEKYVKPDCVCFVTVDPAASEKETADHTAMGVWVVTPHNDLLLVDIVNERLGVDRIVPKLLEVCEKWNPAWVAFESTGFQLALTRQARRVQGIPPVRELSHDGKGKLVRATPAIILAESGQILLPQSAPWKRAYLDQLIRFTGLDDKEDDCVDVTAYAVWQMATIGMLSRGEDIETEHSDTRPGYASSATDRGLWGRR